MIENILKEIGLSKNETKIYLALLELGPSPMGKICGKTKIHRRNVYDSIEMLKDKGFVSAIAVNNRNIFEAVSPQRIIEILDEKRADLQHILPELLARQRKKQGVVQVYYGLHGRKVVFEDKLGCREEQYVLGAHEPSSSSAPYIHNYHRRRIANRIPLRMLFISNAKEAALTFKKYAYIKARLLPKNFSSPIAINIYGTKVAILLGSETIDPITILIDDKGLADDFRTYFDMLWAISKPV